MISVRVNVYPALPELRSARSTPKMSFSTMWLHRSIFSVFKKNLSSGKDFWSAWNHYCTNAFTPESTRWKYVSRNRSTLQICRSVWKCESTLLQLGTVPYEEGSTPRLTPHRWNLRSPLGLISTVKVKVAVRISGGYLEKRQALRMLHWKGFPGWYQEKRHACGLNIFLES